MALAWCGADVNAQAAAADPVSGNTVANVAPAMNSAAVAGPADAVAVTPTSIEIAARYPAGSIDSPARAAAALDEVMRARAQVEAQLTREESGCASAFFTTRCLDLARERRHAALARLRPIEIEANTARRRARVDERDRALAEKEKAVTPEPAPREAKVPRVTSLPEASGGVPAGSATTQSSGAANGTSGTVDSNATGKSPAPARATGRSRPHQARSAAPSIDGATEAANMAAFDRKARESAQRQREIAANKAEKEQDRARKKVAAGTPATPATAITPPVVK